MKPDKLISVSEFLAAATVVGAGFAVGGPIGSAVITALGIELSGSVIDNHYRGIKEAWLSHKDGISNHDLQQALTRAYVKALTSIEEKYFNISKWKKVL
jgi:hypothetical protein